MNHNFIVGPTDTDSVSFCKQDMSEFSKEELNFLLKELNEISPEFMIWEDDGYYPACVVLRAKNYVLWDGKKKSVKGSAFKAAQKESALKEMMEKIIDALIDNKPVEEIVRIYNSYIIEAKNIKDISRWSQKKNVTKAILNCYGHEKLSPESKIKKKIRLNETSIWDAIKTEESIQEGDRFYVYPAIISKEEQEIITKSGKIKKKLVVQTGLKKINNWSNDQDSDKLIERVYKTIYIFRFILDMEKFPDYTLKRNQLKLEGILSEFS